MASYTETSWSYSKSQADYVKYFDRLLNTGMSFDEIKTKLPQLENYYQEMVLVDSPLSLSIYDFFRNWKSNRK